MRGILTNERRVSETIRTGVKDFTQNTLSEQRSCTAMPPPSNVVLAQEIAKQWGPALTKAFTENDLSAFQILFDDSRPVEVVLQNSEGEEAGFLIGSKETSENVTLSWEEFHEATIKDLQEQDYLKSESQCLGVLGNRLILETGRFNNNGDVYLESYSLITFNLLDGKIVAVEAFTDPNVDSLFEAAIDESA